MDEEVKEHPLDAAERHRWEKIMAFDTDVDRGVKKWEGAVQSYEMVHRLIANACKISLSGALTDLMGLKWLHCSLINGLHEAEPNKIKEKQMNEDEPEYMEKVTAFNIEVERLLEEWNGVIPPYEMVFRLIANACKIALSCAPDELVGVKTLHSSLLNGIEEYEQEFS